MADWHPDVKAEWDEYRIVQFFCRWLESEGWSTETEREHVDVVARRGQETLLAEVKGKTKGRAGVGVDSMYGQLLRRMPAEEVRDPTTRFAIVVPIEYEAAVLRVPKRVRDALGIDAYTVSGEGDVRLVQDR